MEEGVEQKRLDEKCARLRAMLPYIHPGFICEMGCGSGFVLEFLRKELPESTVIGVDRSAEKLEAALSRRLPDVFQVEAEIPERVLAEGRFDTVAFVWSMHEVYSQAGDRGVVGTLRTVREMLKEDGVMVLQDFLRPPARQVTLGFKNDHTRDIFRRFVREFQLRDVRYTEVGPAVRLDVGDAVEFISKYRSEDEDDWRHEMAESHFFHTMEDLKAKADQAGFVVERAGSFPLSWEALDAAKHEMDFDFAGDYTWGQLVLTKGTPRSG
jgi:SAM-dependent methyltransferase